MERTAPNGSDFEAIIKQAEININDVGELRMILGFINENS